MVHDPQTRHAHPKPSLAPPLNTEKMFCETAERKLPIVYSQNFHMSMEQ